MYETKIRDEEVDGVSGWVWPLLDDGLWIGPRDDWYKVKPIIQEHCTSFDNIIQAGGGCGMYPRLLSKMFKHVYTFEPDAYNFHCLVQNCPDQNIFKFNAVLGDKNQMISFRTPHNENRGTGQLGQDHGPYPMLKIDDFEFESLGMIYLDTEASESLIMYGAFNNIQRHWPLIACEDNRVFEQLKLYGYEELGKFGYDTFYKKKV